MKLNSDFFITGTKTHPICEDYALSVDTPNHLIVVSDGCSSSKNTDVGARLLSHCIKKRFQIDLLDGLAPNYQTALHAMVKAGYVIEDLGVEYNYDRYDPLHATILVAYVLRDVITVYAFGDGYIVIEYTDGRIEIHSIKYEKNAPNYLIYQHDELLRQRYKTAFGDQIVYLNCFSTSREQFGSGIDIKAEYNVDDTIFKKYESKEIANISLISDGIEQLKNVQLQESIPINDAVKELINWKSFTGSFVQRRCRKFFEKIAKEGYFPLDDFSMATIHIEQEQIENEIN